MKNKKGFSKMAYTASQKGYENLIFNYKQMQKSDDELTSLLGDTLINYTNIMRNNDIPSSTATSIFEPLCKMFTDYINEYSKLKNGK